MKFCKWLNRKKCNSNKRQSKELCEPSFNPPWVGNTGEGLGTYLYISGADLQVGCRVGLLARTRTLAARKPPVQPLWRATLLEDAIYG